MKKKKKIVLSLMCFFVFLCGCSNQGSNVENTEISTTEEVSTEEVSTENAFDSAFSESNLKEDSNHSQETECFDLINDQVRKQSDADYLIKDGWLYGVDWDSSGSPIFVKEREEGGDYTKLDSIGAKDIYYKDAFLYYSVKWSDENEKQGIFKIRSSGEDKEQIVDGLNISMQIIDNTIYYTKEIDDNEENSDADEHLYMCTIDGSNEKEIIGKPIYCWYVFENVIIYQDDRDGESLHICDRDGANDKKIVDGTVYSPIYDGQYIYYSHKESFNEDIGKSICTLWKVKPDGSENEKICEYQCLPNYVIRGNNIYFSYADDGYRLYRIDKDGGNLTLISQDKNVDGFFFIGDKIKYFVRSEKFEYISDVKLCNEDGSNPVSWRFNQR